MGIPPPTEASNNRLTEFFSAIFASSLPCLNIKALFAVTKCLLFFNAAKANFFATPSGPPINSIIMSTSSFLTKDKGFLTHIFFGILNPLFLLLVLAEIYFT